MHKTVVGREMTAWAANQRSMRRLGGLVMSAAMLVGLPAPPASAAGGVTAAFAGTLSTTGGLWAPCATSDATHTCPPAVLVTPPPVGKLAPPFTTNGDLRSALFTSATCVDPGDCSLVLAFPVRGYCGFAAARGVGNLLDSTGESHQLDFAYTLLGATFTARGQAVRMSTGEVGDVVLNATVVADAAACLTGTASSFTFAGDLTLVYPKLTP